MGCGSRVDSSFARFRSRALVLTGMGTPEAILDEHVDEVGAGDHADNLVLLDDGNQPLVRAHDDLHEALERGVRRDRQDGALHVFGNRHVAQFVGNSLGSRLAFHIADAMARPARKTGAALRP